MVGLLYYTNIKGKNEKDKHKNSDYCKRSSIHRMWCRQWRWWGSNITHNGTTYGTVKSPNTGKIWLDRNLGAARICESFNDTACYGDYYQWGRNFDGHQDSISATTEIQATDINNAGSKFISDTHVLNELDWARTADPDGSLRYANWSKTDGSSVCPVGFRVPTFTEFKAEIAEHTSSSIAFASFLKLPASGNRPGSVGFLRGQGVFGYVWTSSVDSSAVDSLPVYSRYSGEGEGEGYSPDMARASAYSVRCIKD